MNGNHLQNIKARVNLAREIDKISLKNRRIFNEINWKNKLAEEAEIIIDEDEDQSEDEKDEKSKGIDQDKRVLKLKKLELSRLLAVPVFNVSEYKLKNSHYDGEVLKSSDESQKVIENEESALSKMKSAIKDFNSNKKNIRSGKIINKQKYWRLEK